ncbi:MAG: hypothetical protein JRE70_21675 [Deltaproteobacteria bacterium]|nr:hypothetical protein [Deltaproteobacteria bacterium]
MMAPRSLAILLAGSILLWSCSSQQIVTSEAANAAELAARLPDDRDFASRATHQQMLFVESSLLQRLFLEQNAHARWRQRGYFDASEHDVMEGLLFRLMTIRSAFWGEVDGLGGLDLATVQGAAHPLAHLLVLHAGLALADSATFVVSTFAGDDVAIAKIDEPYYRTAIPSGTYSRLRLGSTSRERRARLTAAWALHEQALSDDASPLARLIAADSVAASLSAQIGELHRRTLARIESIDAHDDMPGRLQHAPVAKLGREMTSQLGDAGYATRALVFKDVSRLKSPTSRLIAFSPEQKARTFALLSPGDLILTYTGGYASDVFIPGEFKHGITYVGDSEDRRAAGVTAEPSGAPRGAPVLARLAENVGYQTLPDGRPADVIEAVAEGVKFSNLETILDTHINRLLVIRPRITDAERAVFLTQVFSYLGDPYDFRFDFADASRQVCTEVIYRGLNGKSGIAFELIRRGGHPTLSADDIVNLHLSTAGAYFEIVLYADADPDSKHHGARLVEGVAAQQRVEALMAPDEG